MKYIKKIIIFLILVLLTIPTINVLGTIPQEEENKTIPLDISVEEGMKWVISGGIIKPEGFKKVKKNDQ